MSTAKVALVQTRAPADPAAGLAHCAPLVAAAAEGGAELILLPEGANFLEKSRPRMFERLRTPDEDPCVQGLIGLARDRAVWILIGSALVRRPDGAAANRSILVDPSGAVRATYDKIHMFDVDLPNGETARESEAYTPGARAVVAETPFGRIGLTICYDMRFPHLYNALARAGATIITAPAAFTRPTGEAHWEVLLRARAIETGAFVLAPAQGGKHEDGRGTWGRSIAIGPWGEVLAKADGDEPCVIFADLDLDAPARARAAIPALKNARTFEGPEIAP